MYFLDLFILTMMYEPDYKSVLILVQFWNFLPSPVPNAKRMTISYYVLSTLIYPIVSLTKTFKIA